MKYLIPVLCAVALFVGCVTTKPVVEAPKVVVDYEKLERRDGLFYFKGEPFTGVAVMKYPNGQKRGEATFKDGKWHGLRTMWHENGQTEGEYTYKDGKYISSKEWDEDGNLIE